uniref:Uncharacterized protein n=1 Tax=Caenorhabditis japonica TaxID=281687 RepID=A0A8R1EDT5_CAEJA
MEYNNNKKDIPEPPRKNKGSTESCTPSPKSCYSPVTFRRVAPQKVILEDEVFEEQIHPSEIYIPSSEHFSVFDEDETIIDAPATKMAKTDHNENPIFEHGKICVFQLGKEIMDSPQEKLSGIK